MMLMMERLIFHNPFVILLMFKVIHFIYQSVFHDDHQKHQQQPALSYKNVRDNEFCS